MTKNIKGIVFWMPLVVGVLFATFVSLLAMHVWSEGHGVMETLTSLLLQALPSILVAIEIFLTWRWKWIGAVIFLAIVGSSLLIANLPSSAGGMLALFGQ
ncbi:MAG TPA: hypothetical protein VGK00_05335 [Anaerolineales bacterium]|jgi:hypothetical protein